ncbi:MAG: FAD-binding oxidoreductase [Alphaproteobacteria bacterium]|nr:FAD-binding oxidoreductase [Alphaproteobacteria bacterium]
MRVAICGGGVIGACLAYYLSREGAKVLLGFRRKF